MSRPENSSSEVIQLNGEQIHEMRNTAGIIQSCARLLQRQFAADPDAGPIVESLMNASNALREQLRFEPNTASTDGTNSSNP